MNSILNNITRTNDSILSSTYPNNSSLSQKELSDLEKLLIVDIRLFVYGWMVLPIAIIGLVLNGFTILVLLHPRMRNFSTNVYLTTLSLANIVCLINFIFLYSIRYIVSYESFRKDVIDETNLNNKHPYESFINLIYGIWSPIFTTFQLYAIYLTVAVTVDRWIYVTWPLKADTICTMKNTFRAVGIIFIFCFVYNLPRWFEIESYKQISHTNRTYYQARTTKFGGHYIFNLIMRRFGYMIFVYGLPFIILLVVNIGIVRKIIEAKRRKNYLLGVSKSNYQSKPLLANGNSIESVSKNNINNCQISNISNTNSNASNNHNNNTNHHNNNTTSNYHTNNINVRKAKYNNNHQSKSTIRLSIASTFKLDPKITLMVMAIVLVFFLCQFPYLIINILATTHSNKKWFHISKTICDFLGALNCCINFLIYCLFGQNFRQIAKQMFCNPSLKPYSRSLSLACSQINEKNKISSKNLITISSNIKESNHNLIKQEAV